MTGRLAVARQGLDRLFGWLTSVLLPAGTETWCYRGTCFWGSRGEQHLIPVNWSCVACDSNSAGAGGGDIDSRDIEASCPENGDRTNASLVVAEGFSSAQSAANESIGDTVGSSGDASLDGIAYPVSTNNDTSGSSDEEIKEPEAASSSDSGGGSVDTSAKSSSNNAINGASDDASISDGGDSVWSSSGSASTQPWNEEGQKTAPPMPYAPSVLPSTAPSASNNGASSSSQTFVPTLTISPVITPTATPTLPGTATPHQNQPIQESPPQISQ